MLEQNELFMDFGETLDRFHMFVQEKSVFSFKMHLYVSGVWMR